MTEPSRALGQYEPALDGVRALCIGAVLLYHAFAASGHPGLVRGGFAGVSVFFTLSGFLITSMLLRRTDGQGGGLAEFWSRRIHRLWPTLFAVVLLVTVLGMTGPLAVQASDVVAATWSLTNWRVIAAGTEGLLHTIVGPLGPTWSLAVEEQIYLVLSILFVGSLAMRTRRTLLTGAAVVAVLVPPVLANLVTDYRPTLEFSTVLRLPEVFVGVGLALWRTRGGRLSGVVAEAAGAVGLVGLLGFFLFVDYEPPWLLRGGYVVVAVLSAALVIGAIDSVRVRALMARRPLQRVGAWSYALYLVHWPILLLMRTHWPTMNTVVFLLLGGGASMLAAALLHHGVGEPLRRRPDPLLPTLAVALPVGLALTLLAVGSL